MTKPILNSAIAVFFIPLALLLSACTSSPGGGLFPSASTATPTATLTPSSTPVPLAASVNGEAITQADFEAELTRYQQAQTGLGKSVDADTAQKTVLTDMEDTLLLAQAAASYGYVVDDTTLQTHLDTLTSQVGGADGLSTWEAAHGYSDSTFRSALRLELAAAWMRDKVTASVPATAEQVHVKQILLYNASDAQQALGYLQAGWTFPDLAAQYDPIAKGELGWFPRGYLPEQAIEEAAFALQPGQYSTVIQDGTGYHILYLVERDPARQLSPDALLTLQAKALQDWLTQRRSESTIVTGP